MLYCDTADILAWITVFSEGSPVQGRMFGGNHDLYPLDDNSNTSVMTIKIISRHCQMSPGERGAESLLVETHSFKGLLDLINVTGSDTW